MKTTFWIFSMYRWRLPRRWTSCGSSKPGRSWRRCLRCGATPTSCFRTSSPSTWPSSSSIVIGKPHEGNDTSAGAVLSHKIMQIPTYTLKGQCHQKRDWNRRKLRDVKCLFFSLVCDENFFKICSQVVKTEKIWSKSYCIFADSFK